jgi:hypothetical protein
MIKGVFCIATTELQVATIVEQLKTAGFPQYDISLLCSDKTGTRDFAAEQHPKALKGAATRAGTSVVPGGALPIPGLGSFTASGPIMETLSGAAAGATLEGLTGALLGLNIPEDKANQYEGKIKNGNILLSVHARDSIERDIAKAIFAHAGAEDIAYMEEAAVAKQELDWRTRAVGPLPAPPAESGVSLPFSLFSSQGTWRIPERRTEEGKIGWLLLWALGIPIPILVVLFLLRG